jgi:hypothetical protein
MATKKAAKKATKKAATKKAATKKAATKKAPAKKAAAKKTATRKAAPRKAATKKVAKKTAPKKTAPKKVASKTAPKKKPAAKKAITPRKALANTRKLLEAKQRQARETPAWQQIGTQPVQGHEGYQSPEAAAKAQELHEGESRMQGIQGSISTHDRHAQGKRDSR